MSTMREEKRLPQHQQWFRAGLCPGCGGKPQIGFNHCATCLAIKRRKRNMKQRARAKQQHSCPTCFRLHYGRSTRCESCLASERAKREQKESDQLCVRCGSDYAIDGMRHCVDCVPFAVEQEIMSKPGGVVEYLEGPERLVRVAEKWDRNGSE